MYLLAGLGCKSKPDIEDCRRACLNYNKIMFWDKVEDEVKDLEVAESAKLRAQREVDFHEIVMREEDPGLMNCITNIEQNATKDDVACMLVAKTADELKECE